MSQDEPYVSDRARWREIAQTVEQLLAQIEEPFGGGVDLVIDLLPEQDVSRWPLGAAAALAAWSDLNRAALWCWMCSERPDAPIGAVRDIFEQALTRPESDG